MGERLGPRDQCSHVNSDRSILVIAHLVCSGALSCSFLLQTALLLFFNFLGHVVDNRIQVVSELVL